MYYRTLIIGLSIFFQLNLTFSQTNLGTSCFYVPEKNNLDIGFMSYDVSYPLYQGTKLEIRGGLRFLGAFEGNRGGFFAFGYFGEGLLFSHKKIQIGWNLGLTAGGGAQAPDKDGWIIQNTCFAQYQSMRNFSFRVGLNHTFVSSGMIQGFSPLLGVNWTVNNQHRDSTKANCITWNALYGEIGVGRFQGIDLGFIGSAASYSIGKCIAGDLALHALVNTHGGYMQFIGSIGPSLRLKQFSLTPGFLLGLGGGGAIRTKGGGLFGGQFGLSYHGKQVYAGIKYQYVQAFSNQFNYHAAFLSLGKTLGSNSKIAWYPVLKSYLGPAGFGNIGARFIAYENKFITMMGSSYWAFTHLRGAYAEGLFEITLHPSENFPFYAQFSGGAGAGASINKKTASGIVSGGLGFFSPWKKCPIGLELAYWKGGNIPQWSMSVYYKLFQ